MKYILNWYVGGSSPAAPPNQQRIRKIKKISIFSKIDQFAHLLWLQIEFIHSNSLSQVLVSQLCKKFLCDMHTLWVLDQMKRTVCCNTPCTVFNMQKFKHVFDLKFKKILGFWKFRSEYRGYFSLFTMKATAYHRKKSFSICTPWEIKYRSCFWKTELFPLKIFAWILLILE